MLCTLSIGSIDTTMRDSMILLPSLLVVFKQHFTVTSSTCILPKVMSTSTCFYYPTALRRVQIMPKTSTNIM